MRHVSQKDQPKSLVITKSLVTIDAGEFMGFPARPAFFKPTMEAKLDKEAFLKSQLDEQVAVAKETWRLSSIIYQQLEKESSFYSQEYRNLASQAKQVYLEVHRMRHNLLLQRTSLKESEY